MRVGDLITYRDRPWFVRKAVLGSFLAMDAQGQMVSLAENDPEVTVTCSPVEEWPYVTARAPGILSITRSYLRKRSDTLERLVDFVQPEPTQQPGSVFFNPALGLAFGDVLVAHLSAHLSGGTARITIPRKFGTVPQKKAQKVKKEAAAAPPLPPKPPTTYDRLLNTDFDDE